LLAGRKLLLADDSVTIQKVIDLTFADEGVRVVSFSNGRDAIDKLEEVAPDIVLADVFMPHRSGYEVCEYVKKNEKLKHVPVMLLVGSFEPFDEAEARRVGADDILTKPFQSIRRLIDRVGALVSSPPPAKEAPTADLPKTPVRAAQEVKLNTQELAVTTANTLPLPEESPVEPWVAKRAAVETIVSPREEKMENGKTEPRNDGQESSDVLLDLGELEPVQVTESDEVVLDLDGAASPEIVVPDAYEPSGRVFVEPQVSETYKPQVINDAFEDTQEIAYEDQVHEVAAEPVPTFAASPVHVEPEPVATAAPVNFNPNSLSPEMIDAIARRVVEMMSTKVVQDIAWEVVPDLAELMIKRQLEEKESQAK
jgi:CheY-like chemotaxis protein